MGEGRATARLLELLPDEDRELLALWANGQVTYRSLARVLGCAPGTVSRRIQFLRRRMEDPVARIVVVHQRELPDRHREVAIRSFCRGERLSSIARGLGMPRHEARRILSDVIGWAKLRAYNVQETES